MGGDFVLEGKVQRQKLVTPKGVVSCQQWQKIARCLDEFEDIYAAASLKLNIGGDSLKCIDLADEIVKWRAILRMSEYLSEDNFHTVPRSIYDDLLSNDTVNFSEKVRNKREECWSLLEKGSDIVTVNYPLMQVGLGSEIDDLLYTPYNADSEESDSDES